MFVTTAALLPPGETTENHKKFQREEAENVEKDKISPNGLFNGRFKSSARSVGYRAPIRDAPDGVDRCPMCTWELEDGMCNSCGYTAIPGSDVDDDASVSSDIYSIASTELDEMLADPDNRIDIDPAEFEANQPTQRFIDTIRRQAGLPPTVATLHGRRRAPRRFTTTGTDASEGDRLSDVDGLSDFTESTGSLRSFVADDMETTFDNLDNAESFISSDSEHSSSMENESASDRYAAPVRRRHREHQIVASSPDPSDSDHSTLTRSSNRSSLHREDSLPQGGSSPRQSSSGGGHSQDIPIQVDSDSDAPPIRRPRRRPAAMSISSDEEDSGARGVNIPSSHNSRSSSDETLRTAYRSPPSSSVRQHHHHVPDISTNRPSPILVDSSPARPSSSRPTRPSNSDSHPGGNCNRRARLELPAVDSTDEEPLANRRSRAFRQNAPAASPGPHVIDGQQVRSRVARLRDQFEQSEPQNASVNSSPGRTPERNREERKRRKQQIRRRQQEMAPRSQANPMGPPQQLAYIDV
ncbi:MAG: hypothetical protein Q9201_007670 [Fulgogasparrea decipioides]